LRGRLSVDPGGLPLPRAAFAGGAVDALGAGELAAFGEGEAGEPAGAVVAFAVGSALADFSSVLAFVLIPRLRAKNRGAVNES